MKVVFKSKKLKMALVSEWLNNSLRIECTSLLSGTTSSSSLCLKEMLLSGLIMMGVIVLMTNWKGDEVSDNTMNSKHKEKREMTTEVRLEDRRNASGNEIKKISDAARLTASMIKLIPPKLHPAIAKNDTAEMIARRLESNELTVVDMDEEMSRL